MLVFELVLMPSRYYLFEIYYAISQRRRIFVLLINKTIFSRQYKIKSRLVYPLK